MIGRRITDITSIFAIGAMNLEEILHWSNSEPDYLIGGEQESGKLICTGAWIVPTWL